jgi:hypothetical protein
MTSDASCRSVAPAPRISILDRMPPSHDLRRAPKAHHTTRVARAPRRLERDVDAARSAFRRIGPRPRDLGGPRLRVVQTRTRDVPAPFCPLQSARRRPTDTSSRCVLPRALVGWSSAVSLRPQRPLHPRTDRGRCSSSTSATDSQGTCTSPNRPMLEATASACAAAARPSETNPRRTTRVMRCLTTPRELWSSSFTLRRPPWRATSGGHGPILRVPDRGTLGPRPQACGVVFRAPGELHFR